MSPKDSVVEKIDVTTDVEAFFDGKYNKAQVYLVTFNHTEMNLTKILLFFIDADNEEEDVRKVYADKKTSLFH